MTSNPPAMGPLIIKDVKVYIMQAPLPESFYYSQGWVDKRSSVVVQIDTEAGVTGYGECLCHGRQPPQPAAAMIKHWYAPMILGKDAFDVEVIWETLYNHSRPFGQAGVAINALSGVDIALWDAIGKAVGKPIHKLIGGAFRTSVQPYATGFYRKEGAKYPEDLVKEAKGHLEKGMTAMKLKVGFGVEEDIEAIIAVRKSLPPHVKLMADFNCSYDLASARRIVYALQPYNIYFLEELLPPEDIDGYAQLKNISAINITAGENLFTIYQYRDALAKKSLDILQPDICSSGGFTGVKKIATLALAHNIMIMPHVWGSGIGLAAALQLIATLPNTPMCMKPVQPLLEFDQSDHPFRTEIIYDAIKMKDGMVPVPDGPGLGVSINKEILERHATLYSE